MRVGGQLHAPAALPPWKRPGTHFIGGWVGPRACLDGCGKISPSPGFDPRTLQPVASRYADYAIPAHRSWVLVSIYNLIKGNTLLFLFADCFVYRLEKYNILDHKRSIYFNAERSIFTNAGCNIFFEHNTSMCSN